MSSASRKLGFSMLLAAILSIGALLVWCVVGAWSFSVVSQFLYTSTPYDRLAITYDGEPLVETTEVGGNITIMRTLDGKLVERADVQQYYGALLPSKTNWFTETAPFQWASHICGFVEPSGLPVYWYAMLDATEKGYAYFVAYDAKTDQRLGYLGLKGFRRDLPPLNDQFILPGGAIGLYNGLFAGQPAYGAREPYGAASDPGAAVFLNGDKALYRVDLARREVTEVKLQAEVTSIVSSEQPFRIGADPDVEPKRRVSATSNGLVETRDDGNLVKKRRVIARTADRIHVLDDAGTLLQSAAMPAEVADRVVQAYLTTDEKILVVAVSDPKHEMTDVYWLAESGEPSRHEQVRLGHSGGSLTDGGWLLSLALPSALVDTVIYGYFWPNVLVATGQSESHSQAIAALLPVAAPALTAVLAVSAVLAALAFRRQKQMGEPAAAAWAVFVLLVGPAGYIGHLLHRVWPARVACRSCGKSAPVTLGSCPSCNAEATAPTSRGIEIFAY
jgi:hypothetical protein